MHIAVRRYAVDPEVLRDLKSRLAADFVPRLETVDGFISYYAVQTGTDHLDTISVFESKEGERESTRLATEFVERNYPTSKIERISLDEGPCMVEHHSGVRL
ncbi:MAG TPA: hypothetical protein VFE17_05080 [Candidatus Baltobacteraceae bacterium]|jgi:hypothetical protein|nr:hypothetical protein [Candidatus Baltobacteraceae bacterium]